MVPTDSETVGGGDTVGEGAIVCVKIGLPVSGAVVEDWNISSVETESVG